MLGNLVGWVSERERQQRLPEEEGGSTEINSDQIRQLGFVTQAHNLLKSLQRWGEKTEFIVPST